jgi:hypothetical protein
MEKIVCLKLTSGEEVVGKFQNETSTTIDLKDVASIVMMPGGQQGQVGLGLMPFLPYADDKAFPFNKSFVMVQFEPGVDMLNNYNRMFGSGIQIAKAI